MYLYVSSYAVVFGDIREEKKPLFVQNFKVGNGIFISKATKF